MPTNSVKAELKWRRELAQEMKGLWRLTWHEDAHVTPGVPDISYVISAGSHETGWLELKATDETEKRIEFVVESSQHDWIARHCWLVPVHFLVAGPEYWWLIHGRHHERLDLLHDLADLDKLADYIGPRKTFRATLHAALELITRR